MFHTNIANSLKLFSRKYFPNRIMPMESLALGYLSSKHNTHGVFKTWPKLAVGKMRAREKTLTSIFVLGEIAFSNSPMSSVQSADDVFSAAPFGGWRSGTKTILPPGILILLMYLESVSYDILYMFEL
jgi:hypothetical protein